MVEPDDEDLDGAGDVLVCHRRFLVRGAVRSCGGCGAACWCGGARRSLGLVGRRYARSPTHPLPESGGEFPAPSGQAVGGPRELAVIARFGMPEGLRGRQSSWQTAPPRRRWTGDRRTEEESPWEPSRAILRISGPSRWPCSPRRPWACPALAASPAPSAPAASPRRAPAVAAAPGVRPPPRPTTTPSSRASRPATRRRPSC